MLAGFADGTLRLFDLNYSSNKKGGGAAGEYPHAGSGEIMAHIQAKGLHTNLIMSLGITEDGRFCFGGVLRGSVEMVCVDLSNVEEFYKNSGKVSSGEGVEGGGREGLKLLDHPLTPPHPHPLPHHTRRKN